MNLSDESEIRHCFELAEFTVSARTGIVRGISELTVEPDEPRIHCFGLEIADTSRYFPYPFSTHNSGAGLTHNSARMAALGEAMEHYCCSVQREENIIYGSYHELHNTYDMIHPQEFTLFSKNQYESEGFRYRPFTGESPARWTWGYSLARKRPTLVPACFVYIPYYFASNELPIGPSISSGLCCRGSFEDAVLYGIYEVIERDAFVITWLNALQPPRLIPKSSPLITEILRERFEICPAKCYLFDLPTDLPIHTVLAVLMDKITNCPAATVGLSCRADAEQASLKALIEAAQGRAFVRGWLRTHPQNPYQHFEDIHNFNDHAFFYGRKESLDHLQFLLNSGKESTCDKSAPEGDVSAQVRTLVTEFQNRNMDIVVVDLTLPDIEALGFYVVKVLIPGMQEVNAEYTYRFLGGQRLYTLPVSLGYKDTPATEKMLNKAPHPLP